MTARRFNRYPAYKDSGVEWLGEIPATWDVSRADAFLRYEKDQIEPSNISEELVFHYSIPSVQETGDGALEPPSEIDSAKLRIVGDRLLVSKLNPRKGVVLIASEKEVPTLCSTEFVPFQVKGCELRWALYLFLAESTRQRLSAVVRSATRSHQRAEIAEIVKIWHGVPPIPEQRAIAAFLDRETARIDALVAKKERLIQLLQEQRTALITRAVTKGLDPNVPMKDSGVEWLGEIPGHWDVKALSRTLLRITYGFTNPMPVADAGPYMLTAFDIGDGEILYGSARRTTEEAFERLLTDKSRPRAGDLLITKDGTLGRVAVAGRERMCINQSVALLRFDPAVDVGFMQHTLRAAPYQERMTFEAGGTAIKHIYITRLARMSIALPAKEEQRAIAAFLDRENARIDALVAKVRDAIARLKELRTALISAAVTGKIDVREKAVTLSGREG